MSLSQEDVVKLVKNAFEIAWTTDENIKNYLEQVDAYVKNI